MVNRELCERGRQRDVGKSKGENKFRGEIRRAAGFDLF